MAYLKIFQKLQKTLSTTNFPVIYFKPKQIQVFESILDGSDVIAVLPTGYGKSCLFQLLPGLLKSNERNGIVIVVSPLNSIMIDQLNTLKQLNIKADILKDPLNSESVMPDLFSNLNINDENEREITSEIKDGLINVLFSHPEVLLSERGRLLLKSKTYQENVVALVVDEAHCIESWWVFNFL